MRHGHTAAWFIDRVLCPLTGHGLGTYWWYAHVCCKWGAWVDTL